MIKFGKWIAKHKVIIVIISMLLLIPSFLGMAATRVNYDILSYLPDSLETVEGQDIMVDEFGMGAFSMVVIEDMDLKDVAALKEKFQDVFDFCAYMTAFRKRHPSITGDAGASSLGFPEISFHGEVPWKLDFSRPEIRTAAVMFAGYDNKMAKEDCVYLLMNPYWEGVWVELPQLPGGYSWHVAANTGDKKQEIYQNPVRISEERILVGPRSVIVLEADQQ